MFKSLSNTPIFLRLFLTFASAALIPAIVIIVLSSIYFNALNNGGATIRAATQSTTAANLELSELQQMNANLVTLLPDITSGTKITSREQQDIDKILKAEGDFDVDTVTYQQTYQVATAPGMANMRTLLIQDNTNQSLVETQQQDLSGVLEHLWPQYKATQDQVITSIETRQSPDIALTLLQQANRQFKSLFTGWQNVVTDSERIGQQVSKVGPAQINPILLGTIISFISSTLLVCIIGYLVNLTITRPLHQLAQLTRRISHGDTQARAPIQGRDEISRVAASMNTMLDNMVRLIHQTQSQRDGLQGQVEKLVGDVSGVGEGDLSVQADVSGETLGVLAQSFNYMIEELSSLIVRVKLVSHEVEKSTTTILQRTTELVYKGDSQRRQIAEAAVEVEQMANASRQVADRGRTLQNVARTARATAQGGGHAVQQAILGMKYVDENIQQTATKIQQLGERSSEINNIVEIIANIAHQTNRLALDAAIQAAMAGENGKGFGAVAADIRRLAEMAKEQTNSIARIVRSLREDIEAASLSMQETLKEAAAGSRRTHEVEVALESIFKAVELQARDIENINQVTVQQLETSSTIVQLMDSISSSMQQSNSGLRDTAQHMERLARLVEQLRASVEAFKLREQPQPYYAVSEFDPNEPRSFSGFFQAVSAANPPVLLEEKAGTPSRNTISMSLQGARQKYDLPSQGLPQTYHSSPLSGNTRRTPARGFHPSSDDAPVDITHK